MWRRRRVRCLRRRRQRCQPVWYFPCGFFDTAATSSATIFTSTSGSYYLPYCINMCINMGAPSTRLAVERIRRIWETVLSYQRAASDTMYVEWSLAKYQWVCSLQNNENEHGDVQKKWKELTFGEGEGLASYKWRWRKRAHALSSTQYLQSEQRSWRKHWELMGAR